MTDFPIPRPVSGDVVDLILDDHRLFETLLREMRDSTADRAGARAAFADVLVAHGEAEEQEVYPRLKRRTEDVGEHEVEHGEEELTILNPAREDVSDDDRAQLGQKFLAARSEQLDQGCGSVDNVQRLVDEARREGLLGDDGETSEG